jgi:quinoprotein dehydrogenase-associated probable ABC transporter substrate-binding protein
MHISRGLRRALGLSAALLAILAGAADGETGTSPGALRVCADPNNMPFSSENEEGFENKLARLVGASLRLNVEYTWWAQRRGFIRRTLTANDCDVLMGVPAMLDTVETTRPYYRSTYVFVYRTDRRLDITSIRDERLRLLKIGVQLIGDNGFNTPPAHAISAQGMTGNVTGYLPYAGYGTANPPMQIISAVENGDIDIAAAWGPFAGYFAKRSGVPMTVAPIGNVEEFAPLAFRFDIAMGVRRGDHALRDRLDAVIAREQPAITDMLRSYGVPLVDAAYGPATNMPKRVQ